MSQHGRRHKQRCIWSVLFILVVGLLTACGQQVSTARPSNTRQGTPAAGQDTLTAVLAASELVVGDNRLPLGVVKHGTPVNGPNLKVLLRFFYVDNPDPTKVLHEADVVYRGQGLPFGIYVAYPRFDKAGAWGIEAQMTEAGGPTHTSRIQVDVLAQSSTPPVGSPAIPSKNLTIKDVPELARLTSDVPPDQTSTR
jgi:hypothetical protein